MSASAIRSLLQPLAQQSRGVLLLLISDCFFHFGFYMLIPYLGSHLGRLGHGSASIGFVLGVRALGQHGLSLIGGFASDRWGARPVIAVGCVLRAASFFALGAVHDLGWVLAALLASGAASALFRPASSAYMAATVRNERTRVFALSTVLNEAGSFLGPLVGILLLEGGFARVCAVSGAIFLAAGLALGALLPAAQRASTEVVPREELCTALRNGRLWAFSLSVSAYFVLFDQLYFLVPLEVTRITGTEAWTGIFFAASSALVVLAQLPTTRFCLARAGEGRSVAIGLAIMAAACLLPLSPGAPMVTLALSVLILTLGTMVAFPFVREIIPRIARERGLGASHGLFFTVAGVVATLGNTIAGVLYDVNDRHWAWSFLATLGLVAASSVAWLERRGALGQLGPTTAAGNTSQREP
jgi:MFS family permease